jgi:hypothetical protein
MVNLSAQAILSGGFFFKASLHIVDSEAVKRVRARVYKGFSIGGKIVSRDKVVKSTITEIRLVEKCDAVPGKRYRICLPEVFVKAFITAYGKPPLDVALHFYEGLGRVMKSLDKGDLTLAMIKANVTRKCTRPRRATSGILA